MKVVDVDSILEHKKSIAYNTNNERYLSKLEVLNVLYDELPSVCDLRADNVLDSSKYVQLARHYNYKNYRLLRYGDINKLGLRNSLTPFHHNFIKNMGGAVLVIFNTLNNKPVSCVFRGITEKEFIDYSALQSMYGFDMIDSNFKYGDWIVIVEGLYDADVLRSIYPNVLAMQTSNVNSLQGEILLSMSNKFIVAFDSDTAGSVGYDKAYHRLKRDNTIVQKLQVYGSDKDVGMLEEFISNSSEYSKRKAYYTDTIDELKKGSILGW